MNFVLDGVRFTSREVVSFFRLENGRWFWISAGMN
jgi:hypothetical protein